MAVFLAWWWPAAKPLQAFDQNGDRFFCQVASVTDGDTLRCADGTRVRLHAVAARESDESCSPGHPCPSASGAAATATLRELAGGQGLQWLHESSRETWPGEIDTNNRFDSHLFGHMHDHDQVSISRGGGQTRRSMQASSLFGLETFGGGKHVRVQGYSLNQLLCDATSRTLRVWPRTLSVQKDGDRKISADISLGLENDQYFDVECAPRAPKKALGTESGRFDSSPEPLTAKLVDVPHSQVVVTLASQPEAIAVELEKIHHHIPSEPAHTNVRTLEKRNACNALRTGRIMWSVSDWGMGEDGFLGVVQCDLHETGRPSYSFDFSDYRSRDEFLVDTQERFGVPFEVLCANIETVGPAYVVFNDIPIDREAAAGQVPIEVDIERIATLLSEFAPQAKVVLRAARAPRGATRYPVVELKALDEPDVANYLREHPQGGSALASPETVGVLYRHTDGVPSRLDSALRKLAVSSLKTVVRSDTDRGDRTAVSSFPPALVNAVAHIEQTQKAGSGSPYDLLKALACLPRGDQIEDIARLNGPKALRLDDALMLVDRGLVDSMPLVGLSNRDDRTDSKTLMVPRPVREYVRSQLTETQARNFDRKMVEIYFGKKWISGKITGSRAARNAASSLCQMHVVVNSCSLIIRYIRLAVSKHDTVQIEAGIRLASAFVECLDDGSHHRAAADLCADILELIPVEGYTRQRTILELEHACNLRMIRKREEARDLLLGLDFSFLSKWQRQSAQLNLALIYERLGETEDAEKAARDCISTDGRSEMALQAKSILIGQEENQQHRKEQLKKLRLQSDRKKAYVNANNIAITLASDAKIAGDLEEARKLLREVIAGARQQQDFYNGARAIANLAGYLPSGTLFDSTERRLLMDAYHFAHAERLPSLFDQCHHGLWKAFEAEGDVENLLRLYRSSSFIWRLHGRDSMERSYLEKLRALQNRMAGHSSDRDYFVVRVIFVLGDSSGLT